MALQIVQEPLYVTLPVGQQIIFAVSDNTTVAEKYKVKFVAEVHVSNSLVINLTTIADRIGTFKTTPNNEGVGIFDFRPVLETFVKPDNEASEGDTSYKLDKDIEFPMHLIDRFALSENGIKVFAIKFYIEYSEKPNGDIVTTADTNYETSRTYLFFNGVLQYDDALTLTKGNYGYDLAKFQTSYAGDNLQFLSNAPFVQYARLTDYGTFPFFNWTRFVNLTPQNTQKVTFKFYTADDVYINEVSTANLITTGGITNFNFEVKSDIMYVGVGPANLRQHNSAIEAFFAVGNVAWYSIQLTDDEGNVSVRNKIYIICPNERGYEGIRLTWLNQWGTWDYYTFNMKSTRTTTTKRIPYQQQGGTWNESRFKIKGWKGGKKNFRVNSTEKIKLNTDFVTEAEGVWFEELINSQDVYIVNEYSAGDDTVVMTNKYIEPVTLTTSSYVKKTRANDKLMQYTFEIEKSKMQRTQAV